MSAFCFDDEWVFPVAPDELWDVLCRTDAYQGWWHWLREFDAPPLRTGARAACVIGPPLPYKLRVVVDVIDVVAAERVIAAVSGDLAGPARLELRPHAQGTVARLHWELELRRPVLSALAVVGRPVLEWGHNWVVTTGVRQFCRAALGAAVEA